MMYKIYNIETEEIIEFESIEETLKFLDENIEGFISEWVENDMEVCGVSDAPGYSILNTSIEEKSEYYLFVEKMF